MKKNIVFILAFFFSVVLVAAVPHQALASTNGWKSSGQNKYYYVNNKKIIGSKKIGKYYYYFDKTGRMVKNKLSKSKIIAITINQMEREVQQKIFKNKSVQNTIISIPKVKLAFIKVL